MKELTEPYDMIFMDAAKGQYIHFMDDVLRLLKTGGILVSDNVLQDGDIDRITVCSDQTKPYDPQTGAGLSVSADTS